MNNEDKKRKIREWQSSGFVHPLTCGKEDCRYPLRPIEKDEQVLLECPVCGYIQTFIPEPVLRINVEDLEKSIKKFKEDNENSISTN